MTAVERIEKQLRFIRELDKLKQVRRRSYLIDGSRLENSVEHSWHLALMAMIFQEYTNEPVDVGRVIEMVLVHDIVEIDAGDTFAYDDEANRDKHIREQAAADRLFGMLPEEQGRRFRNLWEEFEEGRTAEARFAQAIDRFQPMFHNVINRGKSWREHGVTRKQVIQKNRHMAEGAEALWACMQEMIEELAARGDLPE